MTNFDNSYPIPNYYNMPQRALPQVSGNVYIVSAGTELNNIPFAGGIIVGLNYNENILYVKGYVNGMPQTTSYKITPIPQEAAVKVTPETNNTLEQRMTGLEQQLQNLSNNLNKLLQDKKENVPWDA